MEWECELVQMKNVEKKMLWGKKLSIWLDKILLWIIIIATKKKTEVNPTVYYLRQYQTILQQICQTIYLRYIVCCISVSDIMYMIWKQEYHKIACVV